MMSSKARQFVYGLLAMIGIFVTWHFNIQFMLENGGFSVTKFVTDNYVNSASASITNDLMIAVITFMFWSFHEVRRIGMKHWWVYIVLTWTIAIAFVFPLFLLMRERHLESTSSSV